MCPATVMRQWLRELRTWHPLFRVIVMHDSSRAGHHSRPPFRWVLRLRIKARIQKTMTDNTWKLTSDKTSQARAAHLAPPVPALPLFRGIVMHDFSRARHHSCSPFRCLILLKKRKAVLG